MSVIAVLALLSLIGMGGFAVDLNRGYEQRMINQRVADMAALGAAIAYRSTADEGLLMPTARDIAVANGLAGATIAATLQNDVPAAGSRAVRVTVTMPVSVALAQVLGAHASYDVSAAATATLDSESTPACIIGLASSGNAIETQGGATIDAAGCAVAGVGSVKNGGTAIRAEAITSGAGSVINDYGALGADKISYAGSFTNPAWNTNVPAPDKRVHEATSVVDPLSNNLDLGTARSLIGTSVAPQALANPVTPAGTAWSFGGSPSASVAAYRVGSSANFVVPPGNYTIGALTIAGGSTVTFQAGSTVTVAGGVTIGGGCTVRFEGGTYSINGGFVSGSSGVTFGNGDVRIGSGTVTFAGTNRFGAGAVTINAATQLGGGATVTMGAGNHAFQSISIGGGSWMWLGDGNLSVGAGVAISGDSSLIAGSGEYRLGRNAAGNAIDLGGSARFFMGDGLFSADGSITSQGGSRVVFGRTANHLVNGNMTIAGAVLFGAGRYTVAGNFSNGTGGTTWPYTSPINGVTYGTTLEGVSASGFDMVGVNVSFVLSGTVKLGGGAKTKLIAPGTTTSGGAIADILIDSLTSSATAWSGGAQSIFVGAVHLPNSTIGISGGSAALSDGGCFMLIGNRIVASGGATAGTACPNVGGGGSAGGEVALIG